MRKKRHSAEEIVNKLWSEAGNDPAPGPGRGRVAADPGEESDRAMG